MAALRRTWPRNRAVPPAPLERAVPTYSDPSTEIIEARRLRMICGANAIARVSEGRKR